MNNHGDGAFLEHNMLRQLPSVDALLKSPEVEEILKTIPRRLVVECIRSVLDTERSLIFKNKRAVSTKESIIKKILLEVESRMTWTLRPVVNATGVIIHTNLGRSLLPDKALERIREVGSRYNNLEYDLDQGLRGSRYAHAERLLIEITGAEGALVVNNNAAAVFLILHTFAKGREVIVSRGELVEIGGSFRIPDVMASSGAVLREVGCTNRTHHRDYEQVISDNTAMLLKVHKSNYRIIGFTCDVTSSEIVKLANKYGLLAVEDMGSGCFVDLARYGLKNEPTVQGEVAIGLDLVTFSGDKLLGGPQAGIIIGRKELIEQCKKNPMTRAFRVDKLTLAALEATLRLYLDEDLAFRSIPTLTMIAKPLEELEACAQKLASLLRKIARERPGDAKDGKYSISVERTVSRVGGGSLPEADLPSWAVTVGGEGISAARIEKLLREQNPPIIVRIENDVVWMDVRTILPDDETYIAEAFARIFGS